MRGYDIQVIRGVVVNEDQVVQYLIASGKTDEMINFCKAWMNKFEEFKKSRFYIRGDEETVNITPGMSIQEMIREYRRIEGFIVDFIFAFNGDFIHNWSCCTDLAYEKYVLGYRTGKISGARCNNEITTYEDVCEKKSKVPSDEEILVKLKLIGLEGPLQSICMPNFCPFC